MRILHKQSLVYIITGIIVFCGICIITWLSLSRALYKDKLEDINYFANVALNKIDLFLFEKECGLKTLSSSPLLKSSFSRNKINERLIQFRNLNKSYISISYFDMNRIRIADTSGLCIGKPDYDHSFWRDIKKGQSSIGSYIGQSSSLKKNVIYLAVPVKNKENKLKGAIVARIPNEFLNNILKSALKQSSLSKNLYIDLYNNKGLIIFSNYNPKSILTVKSHNFDHIYENIRDGKSSGSIINDKFSTNKEFIEFYAKEKGFLSFKGNNWILILHYPLKYVYAPVYSLMLNWFMLIIPCLIIAILFCLYLSKKLFIPLNILSKKVIDFGNGDLKARAAIKTNDEIGSLASTFNKMADNLEKNTTSILNLEREVDIRTKVEDQLKSQKKFSDSVLKTTQAIILVLDNNGNIEYFNSYLEKISGYKLSEMKGKNWISNFLPKADQDKINKVLNKSLSGADTKGNINTILTKNKELKYIDWYDSKLKDSNGIVTRIVAVGIDITVKVAYEKDLKLFKDLLNSSNDAIYLVDAETSSFIDINNTAYTALGYTRKELLSLAVIDVDAVVSNLSKWHSFMKEVKNRKNMVVESKHRKKNGEILPVEVSLKLKNYSGKEYMVAVARDITKRKKTEAILLRDQRIKSIGEVSAGIAHDFNNTLQRILTGAETILATNSLDKASNYTLSRIKESAELSAERVRQLLLFSGQSGIKREKTTFELGNSIENTIQQIYPIIKRINDTQKININIDFEPIPNVYISGFIGEFQDVLYNLFKNSIDAMPQGGEIVINLIIKEDKIKLSISDTGVGMDKETASKAFEPFYTTKKIGEGTGVGLSSAYGIIKNMDGEIYIKNTELKKGTEFEIILPIASKIEIKKEHHNIKIITTKILWVEDDKDIREMGKTLLEIIGHHAIIADSGKEALKILKRETVDIMITDIGMPEMNGWELIDKVKNSYPEIKIAVVSGWNNDISRKELEKRKIIDIIQKPINKKQLAKLIRDIVGSE